jgi:hypothetical protein
MRKIKHKRPIILCLVLLLITISTKPSLAVPEKISKNFLRLNDQLGSGLQLFINRDGLNHDLVEGDYKLRIFFDGRSLLKDGENYPKNIKVEVYTNTGGDKELLTILNRTVKNQKAAKNVLLITKLPRLDNTADLYFDIFDTNNILDASFVQNITITNSTGATASSQTSVPDFNCASDDGECLIEYILRNVTFSANFDRHLKTEVFKNDKGRYTVNLPVKKGRKLGKKVRKFNAKGGGKGGNTTNNNFDLGTYPFFEDEVETGRLFWDSINQAIKFNFGNNGNLFSFNKDGSLELGPNLVFEQGSLLTSPQDGAVEYDGNNLYFTTGSTRSLIYTSGNSNLVDLSNGGFLNGNITFIGSSMINDAVFNGSFQYKTGAGTGLVLTSDANGNASWQAAPTGADNLGNHIANQGLTMSGFSITNIDQVNGNTANFTDVNTTNISISAGATNGYILASDANGLATWQDLANLAANTIFNGVTIINSSFNNGNINNSFIESPTINGNILFTTNSTTVFNGNIIIPGGATNNFVLTSDANGNATWQAPPSSAGDNLGNHIANQGLTMSGFSITNIDQANGNTANFTTVNTTDLNTANGNFTSLAYFDNSSRAQFNGEIFIPTGAANGYVLASDANGFATWVSAASLSGTGDNLGNHNALQRIDMGGFTLRNADQVNGNTANIATINSTDLNTANGNFTSDSFFANSSTIQINGSFAIRPGAGAGLVLTSDATGNTSWQPVTAGLDTNGQVFVVNSNVISNNGSSADYQDDFVVGSPSLDDTGVAANDSRMFFNKARSAFRAGIVTGSTWDDTNLGNGSFAFGYGIEASGIASGAWGSGTATGDLSTAYGLGTIASGNYSTSWGFTSIATGEAATSWGATEATGDYSTAWGGVVTAAGNGSTAFGNNLTSNGERSVVIGVGNAGDRLINSIDESLMIGFNSNAATFFVGPAAGGSTTGNIGIATTSPAAKLDIIGDIKITDGTEADGFVLTSDANGLASWQAVTGGGGDTNGQVFVVNSNVISNNGSSADYQDDFVIGSPSLDDTGNAAHDSRMFFDKSRYAFRAGIATDSGWDEGQIGNGSVAFGAAIANGLGAAAWGYSRASGIYATSWGLLSIANGHRSTAWGDQTIAKGYGSTTWGQLTNASDTYSTAWGRFTHGNGLAATAWGISTNANGYVATAWGVGSQANSDRATAWGQATNATNTGATSWGSATEANGAYSTAWGSQTYANGYLATAWGADTVAGGNISTAWGSQTSASGNFSTTFGRYIAVNGDHSIAFGQGNAAGDRLVNTTNSSLMIGFNSNAATLFIGPSAGGSTTGNIGIATTSPAAKLDIIGDIKITDGTEQAGYVLTSDANGLASWQPSSVGASSVGAAGTIQFSDGSGGLNGDQTNFFWNGSGEFALIGTSSLNEIALGTNAALNNLQTNVNALGNTAAVNNNGDSLNALGFNAAGNNTGSSVNALGFQAALNNTGSNINALSFWAARSNTGSFVNALGTEAARFNSGNYINAIGSQSAYRNNGDYIHAFGYQALQGNNGDYNIAIGFQAGNLTRNGSENIMIGRNSDVADPNLNKQINIGNTIYGGNGSLVLGRVAGSSTATLEVNGGVQLNEVLYYDESFNNTSGAAVTINWNEGNRQEITMGHNVTFTFTDPPGIASLSLVLIQDGTGSRTATWTASVHWANGVAPTLTTTAGQLDIVTCLFRSGTYYCQAALNFVP